MNTEKISIKDLRAGLHEMRVDNFTAPDDLSDRADVFEQVIWVEDLGQCYQVHTKHYTRIIPASTMVDVRVPGE